MAGKHKKNYKISAEKPIGGTAIKQSLGSRIFDIFNICLFIFLALIILFPFWNIIAISLTGNAEYMASSFILFPKKPTLEAYKYIFSTALFIRAFGVTFLITITGTALSVLVTSMLAYGLKKNTLHGSKFFMIYLLITMFFSGGLIPTYYNITKTLHLSNNILALILPGAVNVFNFVIMRSFFMQLPDSLEEAARIDGANEYTILFRIIYPLSIPMLATIAMFVAVGLWNSWFAAQLYMRDENWYPLQLIIRNYIVRNAKPADMQLMEGLRDAAGNKLYLNETGIKMACAVVSTIPMLLIYPFIQKYFESGVTIGAVKG